MLFKVQRIEDDLCGNTWIEAKPEYYQAASWQDVQLMLDDRPIGFFHYEIELLTVKRLP